MTTTTQPNWTVYKYVMQRLGWAAEPSMSGNIMADVGLSAVDALLEAAEQAGADVTVARDIIRKGHCQRGSSSGMVYWRATEKQMKCVAIILAKSGVELPQD